MKSHLVGGADKTPSKASSVSDAFDVVANAGGLLGDLVQWMTGTARYPQPLLSLGAALTMVGALMGHRYRLLDGPDTRTNIMVLGLAGSGSGKDHPRTCVVKALRAAGLEKFYLGRGIASAPGIIGALASFHSGVMQLDEAGLFFAAVMDPRAPPYLRQVASLLMELSTSAATTFVDAARAADREPNAIRFDIPDPCLNVFATTVPEPFWAALNSGAADSGFLARFLLLQTPVNYPDPLFGTPPVEDGIPALVGRMRQLVAGPGVEVTDLAIASSLNALQPRWEGEGAGRRRHINMPAPVTVRMTPEAREFDRWVATTEATMKREHEGQSHATAIIARTTEHARRLALVRAASREPVTPEVGVADMRWGFELAVMSQHLMLPAVENYVSDSPWEASLKKLLAIIRRHGDWIDLDTLSSRCYFMKARERNEALAQLSQGGRLEHKSEPTKTKPRSLFRVASGG